MVGELRISASDSLIKSLLLPSLDSFHFQYPDIRIRLSHGKTADTVHRLTEGQIDFGIVNLPVDDPAIYVQTLSLGSGCLYCGRSFP
ncbi:LysR substrate-binding domain-containing protein [Brevibacillus sp. SIMBA_040]|uniref:LysR substrate-binding domain-containing protein n=1 Tax=unclassified Brevibacillus TaxID=2684853 RepID=UPI00397A1A3C